MDGVQPAKVSDAVIEEIRGRERKRAIVTITPVYPIKGYCTSSSGGKDGSRYQTTSKAEREIEGADALLLEGIPPKVLLPMKRVEKLILIAPDRTRERAHDYQRA